MPITPQIPPRPPRIIEVLAFPAVQLLDVSGPLQVFATANEMCVRAGASPAYATRVVAQTERITASAGLSLFAEPLPEPTAPVDTLLVAGGPGVEAATADPGLADWLRSRAAHARRVASVCTGAFLLAASGLLDGRRAVTHWAFCARLQQRHPAVRVDPDPIFIEDRGTWTSAGVTAGIDLALAFVENDLGRALALDVARHLVMFLKRPGGQAQFSTALSLQATHERFASLHDWLQEHLADPLTLPVLASQAGMSERSFSRRYTEATGLTPARAVERLRVEAARNLLSDTRLQVKRIARRVGFGSEETMRRSFFRVLATSPQDYRARFGAPFDAPGDAPVDAPVDAPGDAPVDT